MNVKSRHHLRSDAVDRVRERVADALGVDLGGDAFERVSFDDADVELVLVDGEPAVFYPDGEPFLTVRGANANPPERGLVTVDAGAISFVSDGADVMRPGDSIAAGDLVAINEEGHGKFLAVGRAKTDGDDMVGDSGKVVESIHHVGDDLYEFDV